MDLAQTARSLSAQGKQLFILTKRKSQTSAGWEELIKLEDPATLSCCPTTLVLRYVALTSSQAAPGSLLFRSLSAPFAPLSAKTIGSITKMLLSQAGIPTRFFGPHSNRGAAVEMFHRWGLPSDHVAQLGRWKNLEAFQKHYLRLQAVQAVGPCVERIVHRGVSQGTCAEPEWSRTPCSEQGTGGSDHKGGAQGHCKPTHHTRKRKFNFSEKER